MNAIKQGYKQTKVGIIQEDWEVVKLGDICKFQQGVQVDLELQKNYPIDGYVKFLRIENYTQNSNDFRYIPINLSQSQTKLSLLCDNKFIIWDLFTSIPCTEIKRQISPLCKSIPTLLTMSI